MRWLANGCARRPGRLCCNRSPIRPAFAAVPLARRLLPALVVATAVACPVFLLGLYVDSIWVRLPAKPWPHLLLIAWLFSAATGAAFSAYASRIAAAIALCMVADVLLEFRGAGFLYGMGVFLAAQLTFAVAFTMHERSWRPALALPFIVWLGAAFAVIAPGLDAMLVPVMAYMAAIGTMLWRAAAWFAASRENPSEVAVSPSPGIAGAATLALVGAVVFAISDTVIALDRFHAPVPAARYFIILTYWAALWLIAASAVRLSNSAIREPGAPRRTLPPGSA